MRPVLWFLLLFVLGVLHSLAGAVR